MTKTAASGALRLISSVAVCAASVCWAGSVKIQRDDVKSQTNVTTVRKKISFGEFHIDFHFDPNLTRDVQFTVTDSVFSLDLLQGLIEAFPDQPQLQKQLTAIASAGAEPSPLQALTVDPVAQAFGDGGIGSAGTAIHQVKGDSSQSSGDVVFRGNGGSITDVANLQKETTGDRVARASASVVPLGTVTFATVGGTTTQLRAQVPPPALAAYLALNQAVVAGERNPGGRSRKTVLTNQVNTVVDVAQVTGNIAVSKIDAPPTVLTQTIKPIRTVTIVLKTTSSSTRTYDKQGRIASETFDGNDDGIPESRTTFTWSPNGQLLASDLDAGADGTTDASTSYVYTPEGDLQSVRQVVTPGGAPGADATTTWSTP